MLRIYLPTQYVPKGGNCAWTTGNWSRTYVHPKVISISLLACFSRSSNTGEIDSLTNTHSKIYPLTLRFGFDLHLGRHVVFQNTCTNNIKPYIFIQKFHENRANWYIYCIKILPKWHTHLPIHRQADTSLTIIFRVMCQDSLWQQQPDTSAAVSDGAFPVFCCLTPT